MNILVPHKMENLLKKFDKVRKKIQLDLMMVGTGMNCNFQ